MSNREMKNVQGRRISCKISASTVTKWVAILVIILSPRRYLVISPSEICVASCILLFEVNPMWIVGSKIQRKKLGIMKL